MNESTPEYSGAILDIVGEGVIAIDSSHRIRLVNRETERIFGYSRGELVGQPVQLLMPVRYRDRHDEAMRKRLQNDDEMPARYIEVAGLRKDGSEFPLEMRFTRTRTTTDGEPLFVGAARDITDRVHARQEIERLHAELALERDDLSVEVDGLQKKISELRNLGPFTLQECIGKGGMGEVWTATHRMLARPAAVKLIRTRRETESDDERRNTLQRFEREAQVTAKLKSPHSIELYDFGLDPEGVFYYVMELLDGLDLQQLVRSHGTLPQERVAFLLSQACHSLREAHEVGLVHRDIKPANLFACRYGADTDFLKILDFGIVTLQPGFGQRSEPLTGEGKLPGTPAYMAPEAIEAPESVDGRADIYALGCVAWFLLTGRPVFEGTSVFQLILAQVQQVPRPPSDLAPGSITPEFEALVMDCLQKSPDARPATAQILRERLDALDFEEPWTPARADEWWAQHPHK